jgi:site-specific recombinase XerC
MWNSHLLPGVGHLQLRQLTPGVVDQLKSGLRADGVGAPTIRKTLSLLQAMLRQAVAWDRLRLNPVKQISKPKAPRQRAVVALSQHGRLRRLAPAFAGRGLASPVR